MHSRMIIRIKLRYTISSQEFELLQLPMGRRAEIRWSKDARTG